MLGMQELIIILVIVVLLFGAKRIPEIMSGLGKGIRTFKKTMDGEDIPDSKPDPTPSTSTSTAATQTPAQEGGVKEKMEPK
jgi:sec-independent protein translocase protein TatA